MSEYELEKIMFQNEWGELFKMFIRKGTNDKGIIYSVMIEDEYKFHTFEYHHGDTFIDLGAHIGTWSILMGKLDPTFQIYSYEALPENFEILKKNIELNELTNVHPFQLAISDVSDKTELIYYTYKPNDDFTKHHRFIGSMQGGTHVLNIPTISLDDVFTKNYITKCRVVKSDCEGCEFKGFATLTPENFKKIQTIVGEYHHWTISYEDFSKMFAPYFIDKSDEIFGPTEKGAGLKNFLFEQRKI